MTLLFCIDKPSLGVSRIGVATPRDDCPYAKSNDNTFVRAHAYRVFLTSCVGINLHTRSENPLQTRLPQVLLHCGNFPGGPNERIVDCNILLSLSRHETRLSFCAKTRPPPHSADTQNSPSFRIRPLTYPVQRTCTAPYRGNDDDDDDKANFLTAERQARPRARARARPPPGISVLKTPADGRTDPPRSLSTGFNAT